MNLVRELSTTLAGVAAVLGMMQALPPSAPAHRATPAGDRACLGQREPLWPVESLRSWVSYSDQLAVVRVTAEEAFGPEPTERGAYIPRRVALTLERVLWHRRGAPAAPTRLSIVDWGWCRTADGRAPMVIDGVARLKVGRRYLVPLVQYRGEWTTFDEGRLRLVRNRLRGGVDYGRPVVAHRLLLGLAPSSAARLVDRTAPYRAAVRLAGADPVRRSHAVYRDGFRVQGVKSPESVVDLGATRASRWHFFERTGQRGDLCIGVHARPRRKLAPAARREACVRHPQNGRLAAFGFRSCRGSFAYGTGPPWAAEIQLHSAGGPDQQGAIWPKPRGSGPGVLWVAPLAGDGRILTVRALDVAGERRSVTNLAPTRRTCQTWRPPRGARPVSPH